MNRKIMMSLLVFLGISLTSCSADITIYPHVFGHKFKLSNYVHLVKIPSELILNNITINDQAASTPTIANDPLAYTESWKMSGGLRWLKYYFKKIIIPADAGLVGKEKTVKFTVHYAYAGEFKVDRRYKKKWKYQNYTDLHEQEVTCTTDKDELYLVYCDKERTYYLREKPSCYTLPEDLFE